MISVPFPRLVFLLAAFAFLGETGRAESPPARPVSVDDLAQARFQRVPGKAYGGASLDTGGSGS